MSTTFTFVPTNNVGKVRTKIQDIRVGTLLNRSVVSHTGRKLVFLSAADFEVNEYIGQFVYPDTDSSSVSYRVISNTVSTINIRGDIMTSVAASGTSAVINEAMFSDEEIGVFLTDASNNIFTAASIGLRAIAANQALLAKKFKKTGIGGIEIEKREIKQILDLADSYDNKAKSEPASVINSFEFADGKRSDDFETDDMNEFGIDLNEYRTA